jgi:hypothetical protein
MANTTASFCYGKDMIMADLTRIYEDHGHPVEVTLSSHGAAHVRFVDGAARHRATVASTAPTEPWTLEGHYDSPAPVPERVPISASALAQVTAWRQTLHAEPDGLSLPTLGPTRPSTPTIQTPPRSWLSTMSSLTGLTPSRAPTPFDPESHGGSESEASEWLPSCERDRPLAPARRAQTCSAYATRAALRADVPQVLAGPPPRGRSTAPRHERVLAAPRQAFLENERQRKLQALYGGAAPRVKVEECAVPAAFKATDAEDEDALSDTQPAATELRSGATSRIDQLAPTVADVYRDGAPRLVMPRASLLGRLVAAPSRGVNAHDVPDNFEEYYPWPQSSY